ncbi:hypothetical protein, partial [Vibrio parahaemolyticus]|uniref:hypothetical protein n=1 Tax=Vibrio parahaemolyticus TaxID=670 RepID=UPI001A9047D9
MFYQFHYSNNQEKKIEDQQFTLQSNEDNFILDYYQPGNVLNSFSLNQFREISLTQNKQLPKVVNPPSVLST